MKTMQPTTPGFVLTSLSFRNTENKKGIQQPDQNGGTAHKSSIAKFDYCLPPEDVKNGVVPAFTASSK